MPLSLPKLLMRTESPLQECIDLGGGKWSWPCPGKTLSQAVVCSLSLIHLSQKSHLTLPAPTSLTPSVCFPFGGSLKCGGLWHCCNLSLISFQHELRIHPWCPLIILTCIPWSCQGLSFYLLLHVLPSQHLHFQFCGVVFFSFGLLMNSLNKICLTCLLSFHSHLPVMRATWSIHLSFYSKFDFLSDYSLL